MRRCNCSQRNQRVYRRFSVTIPRLRSLIEPLARKAPTPRCSPILRRAPRKRRPIIPAAASMRKGNQNALKRPPCGLRPRDPGLRIRSKSQVPIPNKSDARTRTHSESWRETEEGFDGFCTKCFGSAMRHRIAFMVFSLAVFVMPTLGLK